MSEQSVVQLSLDIDDQFFHHIDQSVRASAITPRRASNAGQNTWLQGVPSVRLTRRITPHFGDLSLIALRLQPEFLVDGFSELFATRWFP